LGISYLKAEFHDIALMNKEVKMPYSTTKNSWICGKWLTFRAWREKVREDIGRFYHRHFYAHYHFQKLHAALKHGGLSPLSPGTLILFLTEGRINLLLSGKKISDEFFNNGSRFCMSDACGRSNSE
jgi:hypothetical protein